MKDLHLIFPNFYDIKVIADISYGFFRSSLQALADKLHVTRDDDCEHQAGSDSKITAKCFFELKKQFEANVENCKGEIFGINRNDPPLALGNGSFKDPKGNESNKNKKFQKKNMNMNMNKANEMEQTAFMHQNDFDHDYDEINDHIYDDENGEFALAVQEDEF